MAESSRPEYRPDLQGLRALAIGLVLCSHFGLTLFEGGFLGVDVFFVLSGFLITRLLVRELDETGRVSLARFYARRIRRLFPAMLVMVFAVFLFAVFWAPGESLKAGLAAAPYAITWTSNLFFDFRQLGYFQILENTDYFLHTWSLAVEEQFYLVWPILLLFLLGRHGSRRVLWGKSRTMPMAVIVGGGFLLCLGLQSITIDSAFFQMPARIWEFAVGGWCALLMSTRRNCGHSPNHWQSPRAAALLSCAGVCLILGSAHWIEESTPHPGLATVWPVAGTALLILGGEGDNWFGRIFASRPLTWIGDRSYSVYLWHWPVLLVVQMFIVGSPGRVASVALLLTVLLSMLSYSLIEYPFWKGRLSESPERLVLSSSLSTIIPGIVLTGVILANLNDMDPKEWEFLKLARVDVPSLYSHGCDDWYMTSDLVPCRFGAANANKRLVYIGDSIGVQWFSAVHEAFVDEGWSVTLFTKSACPLVDQPIYYDRIKSVYKVCEDWRSQVLERVDDGNPQLVILGSSSSYDYTDDEWVDGSTAIFHRLARAADQVLVLPGTPRLPFHGPSCVEQGLVKWGELPIENCTSSFGVPEAKRVEELLRQAAAGFDNVTVVGLVDLVCPEGTCRAMTQEGQVVYRDDSHLTDGFVRRISPAVEARLKDYLSAEPSRLE